MKTAFEIVNRLENPLVEMQHALNIALGYFDLMSTDLRSYLAIEIECPAAGPMLEIAGFGFEEVHRRAVEISKLFNEIQVGVRDAHWRADLKLLKTHGN